MLNKIIETIKSNACTLTEWTKEPHIALGVSWLLLGIGYFMSSITLFILAIGLGAYGLYLISKG